MASGASSAEETVKGKSRLLSVTLKTSGPAKPTARKREAATTSVDQRIASPAGPLLKRLASIRTGARLVESICNPNNILDSKGVLVSAFSLFSLYINPWVSLTAPITIWLKKLGNSQSHLFLGRASVVHHPSPPQGTHHPSSNLQPPGHEVATPHLLSPGYNPGFIRPAPPTPPTTFARLLNHRSSLLSRALCNPGEVRHVSTPAKVSSL